MNLILINRAAVDLTREGETVINRDWAFFYSSDRTKSLKERAAVLTLGASFFSRDEKSNGLAAGMH